MLRHLFVSFLVVTSLFAADPEAVPFSFDWSRVGESRIDLSRSYSGGTWGTSMRNDKCEGLSAWAVPGLGGSVRISRNHAEGASDHLLTVAANPGLLHLGSIWFSDIAFFDGCNECLIGAGNYIYLLDIEKKRLGTVCAGEQFITLTPRFLKQLEDRR